MCLPPTNFSVICRSLEGFGFARGRGRRLRAEGCIENRGELPCNTSAGMLSESYCKAGTTSPNWCVSCAGASAPRCKGEVAQYVHDVAGKCKASSIPRELKSWPRTSDPPMDPMPGVLGLHAKKEFASTMQRGPQIALAAGAVVRPLPVRSCDWR